MVDLIDNLAARLVARLRGASCEVAFLDAAARSGGDRNVLLHAIDDVLGDGGEYRCEQIVDCIVDEMIDRGRSFSDLEATGDYVEHAENVAAAALHILAG